MVKIVRVPLREQIHEEVLKKVYDGVYSAGQRLSDSELAAELGVSRTPVREALMRLEREGVVESDLGRGFAVRPLGSKDVTDAYPVVWTLECLALDEAAPVPQSTVATLQRLNQDMAVAKARPGRLLDLDARWHATLLAGCRNDLLHSILISAKNLLRRYEYAYMRNGGHIRESIVHHQNIIDALSRDDYDTARVWLTTNWRFSMDELVEWLDGINKGRSGIETL